MDSSETSLDRIEAHKSTDGRKGGESNIWQQLFSKLSISDLFSSPDEHVPMSPEIYSAVSGGKQTCLEMIRSYGNPIACLKSEEGYSVLHLAAAWGHVELVTSIVCKCPCLLLELDSRDQNPLHVAARAGHATVVEAIVAILSFVSSTLSTEDKERLNIYVWKDINGDTPLHLALRFIHMETAACLVYANQSASFVKNKKYTTPFYMAVKAGAVSLVKEMLKTVDNTGLPLLYDERKCPVHAALKARNTDLLDIFLNKYQSVEDVRHGEGRTCLSYGASIGFYEGVKMLLRRSTKSVYVSNDYGYFPIHIAAEKGHTYVVIAILERCPDSIYLLNRFRQNFLHIASESGNISFALFSYLWAFCPMNQLMETQDVAGNTPPHIATMNCQPSTLYYLLNNYNGNCLYIRNDGGQTPIDIAESNLQSDNNYMNKATLMVLHRYTTSKQMVRKKMTATDALPVHEKEYINTLLVVAALVATVTFAAGFTIPGGFNSSGPNLGNAALATDVKLICFIVFDILAMLYSILTIVTLIWGQLGGPALVQDSLNKALPYLFYSLICMPVGFYCGVYVAFAHVKGILIFLNVTFASFIFLILVFLGPHVILRIPVIAALVGMSFRLSILFVGKIYLKCVLWINFSETTKLMRQWRQRIQIY